MKNIFEMKNFPGFFEITIQVHIKYLQRNDLLKTNSIEVHLIVEN